MKTGLKHVLCSICAAGIFTAMTAVPAAAETTENEWEHRVAANVFTYANIREGADLNSKCVGKLVSGGTAVVTGEADGWVEIESGKIKGYIREDLLAEGEDARKLHELVNGEQGEKVEAVDAGAELPKVKNPAKLSQTQEVVTTTEEAVSVSQEDMDLMAAIIECEAGGESYEGKIGVGAVIMNRIRSEKFPNTLREVIYQSGQFQPTWTGKLDSVLARGASQACYDAARDVFAGANTIGDRLFFHAGSGSGLTIGNQTFY